MIENLLKSVFEKVGKQKEKVTVHSPNSTKIWSDCWRFSIDLIWFFLVKPSLFHTIAPIIYIQVYATFSSKKKKKKSLCYIGLYWPTYFLSFT